MRLDHVWGGAPNALIRTILRKLAFYAPLPHFENPCLLELPTAHTAGVVAEGRSLRVADFYSTLLVSGGNDVVSNL